MNKPKTSQAIITLLNTTTTNHSKIISQLTFETQAGILINLNESILYDDEDELN